jgi:predicted lipid-binding transport protein (Tim44 family)
MGPIAGLAAALGLAALASHFGFGEAMGNILTIALLAMAVLFLVSWFMRKRAPGPQPAYGSAGAGAGTGASPFGMQRESTRSLIGSGLAGGSASGTRTQAARIPDNFDAAAFERHARDQFMALQSAHDARDLQRLRDFVTPELFDLIRGDIEARGAAPQKTEVFGLNAQVLEVVEEGEHYVVSVRFTGSVRDEPGAPTEDLDEVWHLVKPRAGFGGWTIAGIQQMQQPG